MKEFNTPQPPLVSTNVQRTIKEDFDALYGFAQSYKISGDIGELSSRFDIPVIDFQNEFEKVFWECVTDENKVS